MASTLHESFNLDLWTVQRLFLTQCCLKDTDFSISSLFFDVLLPSNCK